MTGGKRITIALVAAVAGLALAASTALASTVTISSNSRLSVTGEGGERNGVNISYNAGADTYTVTDTAGADGSGLCTDVNATTVSCPGATITALTVKTGAGADVISLDRSTLPQTIKGTLEGGAANDLIIGGVADDALIGGTGSDALDGGPGGDDIAGGNGVDTIFYADRTTPLSVTIGTGNDNDGNQVDQSGNARDTVRSDIEQVIGGSSSDSLRGDGSNETLIGNAGDDVLIGGGGGDQLLGGDGDDLILGESGNDLARGEGGADRLRGGDGGDKLVGGPDGDVIKGGSGVDILKGKDGIDRLFARDGIRDRRINCGAGPNKLERVKRDKGLDPKAKRC